jgi:hypothetical protein
MPPKGQPIVHTFPGGIRYNVLVNVLVSSVVHIADLATLISLTNSHAEKSMLLSNQI